MVVMTVVLGGTTVLRSNKTNKGGSATPNSIQEIESGHIVPWTAFFVICRKYETSSGLDSKLAAHAAPHFESLRVGLVTGCSSRMRENHLVQISRVTHLRICAT
jgi:hypothetical protein